MKKLLKDEAASTLSAMNPENFVEYIENPSFLHQLNYEELKQLILQYPYNANLRYLLVKKSQMENRGDYERNLRNAAVHGPDRKRLFELLKEELLIEDRLELKQLNEISLFEPTNKEEIILEIPKKEPLEVFPNVFLNDTTSFQAIKDDEDEELTLPIESLLKDKEQNLTSSSEQSLSEESSEPLHRSKFSTWKQRYAVPNASKLTIRNLSKEENAARLAENSLEESEAIASETLANILTHQDQNEKAIEVYEKLALHFPEKSDFFAQQIKKLKEK